MFASEQETGSFLTELQLSISVRISGLMKSMMASSFLKRAKQTSSYRLHTTRCSTDAGQLLSITYHISRDHPRKVRRSLGSCVQNKHAKIYMQGGNMQNHKEK